MPRRWCAACAFVRSFAYSECPLTGETEAEKRRGMEEMEKTGRVGRWREDRNSEKRKGRKTKNRMTARDREEKG